jgi:O-antigen ligase
LKSWAEETLVSATAGCFGPLLALMVAPSLLFLGALLVLLFRPPELSLYAADRIAFAVLCLAVLLRAAVLRQPMWASAVTWPMLGLLVLALSSVSWEPCSAQTWSLLAAKFVVPYTLFHLAGLVFDEARAVRQFEIFVLVLLAYLSFLAIASLAGMETLILPRYILDPSLGIHADRARGPFLQAVANGVSLNLLGLVALDAYRRRSMPAGATAILLGALPLAILATMTRAVWLGFAASVVLLLLRLPGALRKAGFAIASVGLLGLIVSLSVPGLRTALEDRAEERGPVDVRLAVYRAASEMFQERPLLGWGVNQVPTELAARMEGYHMDAYWAHNTYLEVLLEQGAVGLALYVWILVGLFRLARDQGFHEAAMSGTLLDPGFRRLWPVLLGVYVFNGFFVVMNYQFVNAIVFTLAGMLAAQNRRLARRRCYVLAG